MPDPGDHLARLRRADSQVKAARVRATLEAMTAAGEPPGISQLARRARVSRRFIYDHPDLRAEITHQTAQIASQHAGTVTTSAAVTTASLRADLENAKARNRRLESDLAALRRRLGEVIGQDVLSQISAPEQPSTAERAGQLEQALSGAQEALAQRTEELEAARQINRELMARLNRES
jgi:Family of unknown function (DUF6262)